ncbi:hypothetical protein PTTG_07246 [Puccinia triticina 1-1 BBBD Race 1]|uniref:Uncharacterized protein n=1 Tax=Puccinia triticina (isolate 1-1 / race 1 (BBBD)) TaxID=630390 RepID=A0A180GL83_PUCT1|nr:hypothetical protein PTTG_07246 [Puccinia triticina 1-1 BBBD Race 1]
MTFKLYCPKLGKVGWNTVKTKKVFALTFNTGSLSLIKFCSLVATEAGKIVDGADELINNTVPKGTLSWQVSMAYKSTPEFCKKLNYTINNEESYSHWIKTMKANLLDHTHAGLHVEMNNPVAVAKEAQIAVDIRTHVLTERAAQIAAGSASALATSVPGSNPKASNFNALDVVMNHIYAKHPLNVKYMSKWPVYIDPMSPCRYIPLTAHNTQLWAPSLQFEKLSAYKKRKLLHVVVEETHPEPYHNSAAAKELENSSVVEPNEDLMAEYLDFVKIKPSKKEEVLQILIKKDITHPSFLKSASITQDTMARWSLSPGIISQLRYNTKKFEKHRAPQ